MTSSFAHDPYSSTPYAQHFISENPNNLGFGLVRNTDEFNKIYKTLTNEINAKINAMGTKIKLGYFSGYKIINVSSSTSLLAADLVSLQIGINYPDNGSLTNYNLTLPSAADVVAAVGAVGCGPAPGGYPLYISFVPTPSAAGINTTVTIIPPNPSYYVVPPVTGDNVLENDKVVSVLLIITNSNPNAPEYKVLFIKSTP